MDFGRLAADAQIEAAVTALAESDRAKQMELRRRSRS